MPCIARATYDLARATYDLAPADDVPFSRNASFIQYARFQEENSKKFLLEFLELWVNYKYELGLARKPGLNPSKIDVKPLAKGHRCKFKK
jgi:hypothetical protein